MPVRPTAQIERETNTRQVHQVPMRIHEAGHRGAPAEVDNLFAGRGIHVGAPAGERHATVAHDERVDDRPARVERVDPTVGQQHRPVTPALRGRRG
jgi:hypothetical protein